MFKNQNNLKRPNNCKIYAIFHLNLAFSSIDEEDHPRVIDQCYWPLLYLTKDHAIPIALELSIYTIEKIAAVDSNWISCLKDLLKQGKCDLLACGDSQIIGPLVPAELNYANLELGKKGYRKRLEYEPTIAYINEQAFSSGLLDIYLDCGYDTVVVEWENPYSHNIDWDEHSSEGPQYLVTASGRKIKAIWNRAIAFQKLQRYAHGEYCIDEYLEYIEELNAAGHTYLCIYGNDAEVFNFRPGRFSNEKKPSHDEWDRIKQLFNRFSESVSYDWILPTQIRSEATFTKALNATTAAHPIAVKKQAKYNITRWAVSGRNDLCLNTYCHHEIKRLGKFGKQTHNAWRELCRLWASDMRTHLTEQRYAELLKNTRMNQLNQVMPTTTHIPAPSTTTIPIPKTNPSASNHVTYDTERHLIIYKNVELSLVLNTFRGLSIHSLAFKKHEFTTILGTLKQGYFDHILFGADFYSNHLVAERFKQRDRVTDLNQIEIHVSDQGQSTIISCTQASPIGRIFKWYRIEGESLSCGFAFDEQRRPECSLRLGFITLKNTSERAWYAAHFGSDNLEFFQADTDFDHGSAVSSITSSTNAISATSGLCYFGCGEQGLKLQWKPSLCAPILMASSKVIHSKYLNRLWFSLVESDETLRADGSLLNFEYKIEPAFLKDIRP